jgi:hypothetical protein
LTSYLFRHEVPAPRAEAPLDLLLERNPAFVIADISARHPAYSQWTSPVRVFLRREPSGWTTVGIERGRPRP